LTHYCLRGRERGKLKGVKNNDTYHRKSRANLNVHEIIYGEKDPPRGRQRRGAVQDFNRNEIKGAADQSHYMGWEIPRASRGERLEKAQATMCERKRVAVGLGE